MSTPRDAERDAAQAEAFRNLEGAICDLRCAALLMDMAANGTVNRRGGAVEDSLRQRLGGLKGYVLHVLTEDDADGLTYALNHLGDLARQLHDAYHATWDATRARERGARA